MAARKQHSFQIIPTSTHGMIDYGSGILMLALPYLLGFADGSAAQWVPQVLGIMVIGASLLTRYELGLYGLIPMPMHLMLDVGVAILLAASPWIFGFSGKVFWPHLIVGLLELSVVPLTRTQPQKGAAYA